MRDNRGVSKLNLTKKFDQISSAYSTSAKLIALIWKIDYKLFSASIVAIILPGVIPFINIYVYKLIIDEIVKVIAGAPFNPALFYPLIATRIITYFIMNVSFMTQDLVARLLWTKLPIEFNQLIFSKISSLDIQYYENDEFRNQLEKVREARDFHPQRLIENLLFSLQSVIQVLIALFALIQLKWWFAILILFIAIPDFILQSKYSKLSYGIWNQESGLKKRFGYLQRMLEGHREHKEIKLFSLATKFLSEMRSLQQTFYNSNTKLAKDKYTQSLGIDIGETIIFVGIELYVIFQALAKKTDGWRHQFLHRRCLQLSEWFGRTVTQFKYCF